MTALIKPMNLLSAAAAVGPVALAAAVVAAAVVPVASMGGDAVSAAGSFVFAGYAPLVTLAAVSAMCCAVGSIVIMLWYTARQQQPRQLAATSPAAPAPATTTQTASTSVPGTALTPSKLVDEEIHLLLDNVFREFIDNWYPIISSDRELRCTLRAIMEECIRKISTRVCRVKLLDVLFLDVIYALRRHVHSFRTSKELMGTTYAGGCDIDALFGHVQPHFALSNPDREKEYIKQITEWVMFLTVPEQEHQNEILRVIVRELLVNVVLLPSIDKLIEPDFLVKALIMILAPNEEMDRYLAVTPVQPRSSSNRSSAPAKERIRGGSSTSTGDSTGRAGRQRSATTKPTGRSPSEARLTPSGGTKSKRPRVPKILSKAFVRPFGSGGRSTSGERTLPDDRLWVQNDNTAKSFGATLVSTTRNFITGQGPSTVSATASSPASSPPLATVPAQSISITPTQQQQSVGGTTETGISALPTSASTSTTTTAATTVATATTTVSTTSAEQPQPRRDTINMNLLSSLKPVTARMTSMLNPNNIIKPLSRPFTSLASTTSAATTVSATAGVSSTPTPVPVPTTSEETVVNSLMRSSPSFFSSFLPKSTPAATGNGKTSASPPFNGAARPERDSKLFKSASHDSLPTHLVSEGVPPLNTSPLPTLGGAIAMNTSATAMTACVPRSDKISTAVLNGSEGESPQVEDDTEGEEQEQLRDHEELPDVDDDKCSHADDADSDEEEEPDEDSDNDDDDDDDDGDIDHHDSDEDRNDRMNHELDVPAISTATCHSENVDPSDIDTVPLLPSADGSLTTNIVPPVPLSESRLTAPLPETWPEGDDAIILSADEEETPLIAARLPMIRLPDLPLEDPAHNRTEDVPETAAEARRDSTSINFAGTVTTNYDAVWINAQNSVWWRVLGEARGFVQNLWTTQDFGPFAADVDTELCLDEPLFDLVDDIFQLSQSIQSWIVFLFRFMLKPVLHVCWHGLVNRIILFALSWLVSEKRIAYYVKSLREALWIDGRWSDPDPVLTPSQAQERRDTLRSLLNQIVGPARMALTDKVADDGIDFIIETIQSKTRNKHMIFIALDVILAAVFPEMANDVSVKPLDMAYLNNLARVDSVSAHLPSKYQQR